MLDCGPGLLCRLLLVLLQVVALERVQELLVISIVLRTGREGAMRILPQVAAADIHQLLVSLLPLLPAGSLLPEAEIFQILIVGALPALHVGLKTIRKFFVFFETSLFLI